MLLKLYPLTERGTS